MTQPTQSGGYGGSSPRAEQQEIHLTRVFDAPPDLVYRAFVDPDQVSQWFGPVGFSVPRDTVEIDARTGGSQRLVMVSDTDPGFRNPIDATYTEVVENEVLDALAQVEGIPGTTGTIKMRLRLEFHPEPNGKTRLELTQGPFTEQMGTDTKIGWESSFTKLDSLLTEDPS
jgi:uncharacterized protein YndB with AHSA1/START domain